MSKEVIRPSQFARADAALLAGSNEELMMNEEQIKALADLYAGTLATFQPGKLISGTIVKLDSDGALIDIGYKSDGVVPRYEFSSEELEKFKVGDSIEVILDQLESTDGTVVLSYEKAKALKAWDSVTKLFEDDMPVEGIVTHKVKGGLNVDIGIPAFLPGSQIDLQRVTDFDQYVGQKIMARIIKVNKKRGNVIISRRKQLSDQRSEFRQRVLDTLQVNQVIQGVVKNITNYGVFVDIGGVDGLLHITDMTWGRIAHPSELVKIGDKLTVKVLSFDKEHEKISLGLKQLSGNPWEKVAETLKVSSVIKGKIASITDYGLFIEIEKGVEGLVHISEISWTDRITDLHKKFKVGEEIDVMVVSLDPINRRMSLSIKQMEKNPWQTIDQQFKVGQKIKGTVSNITDFGIFVQLLPGIDGLVHISDLSWTEHIAHPSDLYRRGDEVEAVILNVDKENKKVSLGIKQLSKDPWETIETDYPVGTMVECEVSKITNFGAFVKLPTGVEGLVHISELSDNQVEKVDDILKVGQKAQFKVIGVNKNERKLGLSLRTQPAHKKETARAEASVTQEKRHVAQSTPKRERTTSGNQNQQQAQQSQQQQQQTTTSKSKSSFQLELEKHAARQKEESDVQSSDKK